MLLAGGGILAPDFGLLAWTSIIFVIFWVMIYRAAGKPIKTALSKRNSDIQDALDEAEKAKTDMANLRAENEKIVRVKITVPENDALDIIDDVMIKSNVEACTDQMFLAIADAYKKACIEFDK